MITSMTIDREDGHDDRFLVILRRPENYGDSAFVEHRYRSKVEVKAIVDSALAEG